MLIAPDWITVMKLALVWVLVLVSGATVCCLIADHVKPAGQATDESGRNDP
jgi:hypothetical protein